MQVYMEKTCKTSDYRRKLEKTLASPALMNDEKLQTLVRNQILQSSYLNFEGDIENVVGRRSKEVSNFLSMLRSASEDSKSSEESQGGWKVKQETDEFRVMYREGSEGTLFHTLLVEGYVDGPLDVCLCVSWETGLYDKWWPQSSIPSFKIISSKCLKRIGNGEQISLVRMKVSWPLSSREAVLHYFAFEYFQDDLMVVLFNSISDSETIDRRTHGFTRDGIPNADELVRIDVVGGFACQKVAENRCYFRAIASLDVKLDFVPPSFINFISRQLLGHGFKLFKKRVASVSEGDENFREALMDRFYTRIRDGLSSRNSTHHEGSDDLKRSISIRLEDQSVSAFEDDNACCDESTTLGSMLRDEKEANEIDECNGTTDKPNPQSTQHGDKFRVGPKVKEALGILEMANSMIRERRRDDPFATKIVKLKSSGGDDDDQMSRNCGAKSQEVSSVEATINHESRVKEYSKPSNSSVIEKSNNVKRVNKLKNSKLRFCCLHMISL